MCLSDGDGGSSGSCDPSRDEPRVVERMKWEDGMEWEWKSPDRQLGKNPAFKATGARPIGAVHR